MILRDKIATIRAMIENSNNPNADKDIRYNIVELMGNIHPSNKKINDTGKKRLFLAIKSMLYIYDDLKRITFFPEASEQIKEIKKLMLILYNEMVLYDDLSNVHTLISQITENTNELFKMLEEIPYDYYYHQIPHETAMNRIRGYLKEIDEIIEK